MKYVRAIPLTFFLLSLLVPSFALADAPFVTLLANGQAQYRFEYRGDRSRIQVALDTQGVAGIQLLVFTPAQLEAAKLGGDLVPVGRGTPGGGHDSFWTGSFNAPGVYEVFVSNETNGPVLYRLTITGDGVSGVAQMLGDNAPANADFIGENTLSVSLPPGGGAASLSISVPGAPRTCTHSYQIPPVISQSAKLCANEIYPPLHLIGNHIALYSDEGHTSIISAGGRQYAVTVDGSYDLVEGVTIQTGPDAADLGAWLCQYDECIFATRPRQTVLNGGIVYGGGILLRGSFSVIHSVTVHGGTIGVATVNGTGNYVLDNQLSNLNGWGIFNIGSTGGYFVGNTLNYENHGCTTPDGFKFLHGCETAGWVCLGCSSNLIARNHCQGSANCFYMSGERGLASNNNKLIANYCAGATDNCFEITFSKGNVLLNNIATADPDTGAECNYPFWIGGSAIYLVDNDWQCAVSVDDALARATASTQVVTVPIWSYGTAVTSPAPAATADDTASQPETGWYRLHRRIE